MNTISSSPARCATSRRVVVARALRAVCAPMADLKYGIYDHGTVGDGRGPRSARWYRLERRIARLFKKADRAPARV